MAESFSSGPEDQVTHDPFDELAGIEGTWDAVATEMGVDQKELKSETVPSSDEIDKQVAEHRVPDAMGRRPDGRIESSIYPIKRTADAPSAREMGAIAEARQAATVAYNKGDVIAQFEAARVEAARAVVAKGPASRPAPAAMDSSEEGSKNRHIVARDLVEQMKTSPTLRRTMAAQDHLARGNVGAIEQMALHSLRSSEKADKARQKGRIKRAETLGEKSRSAMSEAEMAHATGKDLTRSRSRWKFWQR